MKTLFFVLFFVVCLPGCGFMDKAGRLDSTLAEQASSIQKSSDSTGSRRYRPSARNVASGYGSNNNDDDDDDDDNDDDNSALLHRLTSNGLQIEEFLDTAVYLWMLIGECGSNSDEAVHKACVRQCLQGSSVATCVGNCDSANSKACETLSSNCSGVFQANDHILTNHHCIDTEISGYTENNKYYYNIAGTVVESRTQKTTLKTIKWYDAVDDIALVELNKSLSSAEIPNHGSLSDLHLLDELFTIGAPNSIKWTASLGRLTNKEPPSDLCRNCITYSIPIGGGNSGGPVYDTAGKLVGLISASLRGYDNINYGPHIDRIKHLIREDGSNNVQNLKNIDRDTSLLSDRNTLENMINLSIYLWNL